MTLTCISRARRVVAALNVSFLTVCASILAACAVGPNFKKPAAPQDAGYTPTPLSTTVSAANGSAGDAQHFVDGSDISADWWTLFHSTALNELIDLSLANNHDFKAAQAALSVSRETVLAQRGVYYPSVAASFSATRQRQSGQIAPTLNSNAFLYDLFTPQLTISYVPDVFGLNRRTVESLQAQEQEVRFQMIAVYTTLTAFSIWKNAWLRAQPVKTINSKIGIPPGMATDHFQGCRPMLNLRLVRACVEGRRLSKFLQSEAFL